MGDFHFLIGMYTRFLSILFLVTLAHCQFLQRYPDGESYVLAESTTMTGREILTISASQRTKLDILESEALVTGSDFVIESSLTLSSGSFAIGFREGLNSTLVWRVEAGSNPTVEVAYESEGQTQQWAALPVSGSISSQMAIVVRVSVANSVIRTVCTVNGRSFVAEIPEQYFPTVSPISLHLDAGSQAAIDLLVVESTDYLVLTRGFVVEDELINPTQTLPGTCGNDEGEGANLLEETLAAGTYVARTCDGVTNFDTELKVFSGTCSDPVSCLGQNDDSCGRQSRVTFTTTGGPICIGVTGWLGRRGQYTLEVYPVE